MTVADHRNPSKASTKVDARHALRLVDVMENGASSPPSASLQEASAASIPPPVSTPSHKKSPQVKQDLDIDLIEATDISALTPQAGGSVMQVTLQAYMKQENATILQQTYQLPILMSSYDTLGIQVGRVSSYALKTLWQAHQLYLAVLKSMELLGYGGMSRVRLRQKLSARGFSKETAEEAVAYMAERGYLDEFDTAMRFAEHGVKKLWGPRRIKDDLFAKGFHSDIISQVLEDLMELTSVDFGRNCAVLIQNKYGGLPKDPAARRKLAATLMRMGYTSEYISDAFKKFK